MKNVYDLKEFFESYQTMRENAINANNLIENPIIKSKLPSLKNKKILDLGCGDGNMTEYFMKKGAKKVVGIDISKNMIDTANKNNKYSNAEYYVLKMENISKIKEKFDIVYSSLAFHYVKDYNKLIKDINRLLKYNGVLVYSQESPLNRAIVYDESKMDNKIVLNNKTYRLLSDYGNESERNILWNDTTVTKYHRTYCTIVNTLQHNKFKIIDIKDSYATEEVIKICDKYKNQIDKPYFTFIKARKIGKV